MDSEQFSQFRHEAIHQLMRLNEQCNQEFRISSWPRWDYDFGRGTLTFSQEGVPKVRASIQVVGTTSVSGGTWMWAWANESLPANVTGEVSQVRAFGETEKIAELTQTELPDDEYLGWAMTAVAAKLLHAKGAYRCPGDNGFVYVVYSSIRFVSAEEADERAPDYVECAHHGDGFATYICEHLRSNPAQEWFSNAPDEQDRWPDAWCSVCEALFQEEGEWNDRNKGKAEITVICHHCYESLRAKSLSLN